MLPEAQQQQPLLQPIAGPGCQLHIEMRMPPATAYGWHVDGCNDCPLKGTAHTNSHALANPVLDLLIKCRWTTRPRPFRHKAAQLLEGIANKATCCQRRSQLRRSSGATKAAGNCASCLTRILHQEPGRARWIRRRDHNRQPRLALSSHIHPCPSTAVCSPGQHTSCSERSRRTQQSPIPGCSARAGGPRCRASRKVSRQGGGCSD